jgi:drug/metabolite transporter (DMT)-like permease
MRAFAIVLIVVGALMMVYTGFTYITQKNVVDVGPLEINKEEKHPVRWSPIVGALLLLGGVVMIATNKNKTIA